jgi:hypothetical protein
MTASVQNALSALGKLQDGLQELGHERLNAVADVVGKCLRSLASQVEFYESAKAPLSSVIVDRDGQKTQQVTGMRMEAIHLKGTNHVVYGKPEAIAALRALLPEASADDDSWEVYF